MVANDWDVEMRKKYLASSLTGDAMYVLAEKEIREWSFKELCQTLEKIWVSKFGYIDCSSLRRFLQKPIQPLQQLADEIPNLSFVALRV